MVSDELSTNINTILSASGLRHTLHLYTPNVNKYAIQAPFLGSTAKDEKAVYITNENPEAITQELKGLGIDISIIKPSELTKINGNDKLRVVLDANSISEKEHLKIEKSLAEICKNHFMLCTYDVSKLNPNAIKDLVKTHDKLMLTTSDITMLSSESFEKQEISEESIERFVKNELDTIVLVLILNKPMCGTDIIKTIHKEFNVLLSPGTIYPLLHSLEGRGLLKCEYQVKTKLYRPIVHAEPKIRSILSDRMQASKFLSNFLQSIELNRKIVK